MELPSKYLQDVSEALARLPGIGRKTAVRLTLHLLRQPEAAVLGLSDALKNMKAHVDFCPRCHNVSDGGLCRICANPGRDESVICVVEGIQDVIALENTGRYRGLYHILGGLISPMNGVGPAQLHLASLEERAARPEVTELILALNATIEGETTAYYIARKLAGAHVRISSIARGIPVGSELEYADEVTLGRSLEQRTLYTNMPMQNDSIHR